MRRVAVAAVLDLGCVLVFVAIGRANHDDSGGLGGFVTTAWPFLAGLAIGWAAAKAWQRPAALATGAGVWLCTLMACMGLRAVSGQGTAVAFVLVATAFLAMELLGWRVLARVVDRRTTSAV